MLNLYYLNFQRYNSQKSTQQQQSHPLDNGLAGSSMAGIHPSSTGGGTGVETVLVVTSPIIVNASLVAWYIRNISSRCWASSADSSINKLCTTSSCVINKYIHIHRFFVITQLNTNWFSNSFTGTTSSKVAIKWPLKNSPHLKCVAMLPGEIFISENNHPVYGEALPCWKMNSPDQTWHITSISCCNRSKSQSPLTLTPGLTTVPLE